MSRYASPRLQAFQDSTTIDYSTDSAAARRNETLHGGDHRPETAMRRRQASMWRCVRYCGPMGDWWEADEADSARRAELDGATSSLYVNSNFTVGIEGR